MSSRLAPKHYAELHEGSGISPEVIAARGAYTETSAAKLRELGFAATQAQLVPAMLLPIHSLNGWKPTYVIKPDKPRPDTHPDGTPKIKPDGTPKMRKYEYAAGSPNRLDVPPTVREKVMDYDEPLVFTEGWKKADAAASHGVAVVALGGVWNYTTEGEGGWRVPIDDFDHIPLKKTDHPGRLSAIVYDSDAVQKRGVRDARGRLYHLLMGYGARVKLIDLPPLPDGSKCGLDDYLLTHTVKELWALAYDPVEREVAQLRAELAEERRIKADMLYALRNKKIKAERVALVAAVNYLEMKQTYDQTPPVELPGKGGGWYDVPRAAIAEQAGCSPDTAGDHMEKGAKWGVYEKTLDWDPRRRVDADGVIVDEPKKIFMRRIRPASESLALLATIDPPKQEGKAAWGGKREVTCPDHPNAGTVKKWTLHCQECDRALDSGETHKRPQYHDDTPPDKHAEELVESLPPPTRQDDVPSKEGDTYEPRSTPIRQDDAYPPARSSAASESPPLPDGYWDSLGVQSAVQVRCTFSPFGCQCPHPTECAEIGKCTPLPRRTIPNHPGDAL